METNSNQDALKKLAIGHEQIGALRVLTYLLQHDMLSADTTSKIKSRLPEILK